MFLKYTSLYKIKIFFELFNKKLIKIILFLIENNQKIIKVNIFENYNFRILRYVIRFKLFN